MDAVTFLTGVLANLAKLGALSRMRLGVQELLNVRDGARRIVLQAKIVTDILVKHNAYIVSFHFNVLEIKTCLKLLYRYSRRQLSK